MNTFSGESRDEKRLERPPKKGEWAYAKQEAGFWMKGPDLPSGPVTREMMLSWFRDKSKWFKDEKDRQFVDMSHVASYMDKVFAIHTPEGKVFDTIEPRQSRQN